MSQKSSFEDGKRSINALNSLWDEIGYTQEEKDEGMRKINAEIEKVRSKFIESTLIQCQKVLEDTEQIRSKHISMLKAINASEDSIREVKESGRKGTIKEKHDEVKSNFNEFSKIYNQKYKEFENLQKQIDNCFKALGVTDSSQKGEFNEIGEDDLTPGRLRRYEEKISQLSSEVDSRLIQFNSYKKKILSMNYDLQEDLPQEINYIFDKQVYSDKVLEELKEYLIYLKNLLNTRSQYVSEMAVEINRLWDLLSVDEPTRREFLASHNTLSQRNVQDCIDEAERLTKIRNQKLPEIIEKMKFDLSTICQSLGYSKQKEKEICRKCEEIDENLTNDSNDSLKLNEQNQNENKIEGDNKETNENEEEEDQEKNDDQETNQSKNSDQNENSNQEKSQNKIDYQKKSQNEEEETNENDEEEDQKINQNENSDQEENQIKSLNQEENQNENKDQVEIQEYEEEEDNEDEVDHRLLQIFNNFNDEILNLKKTLIFAQPIIDLINQREQIINDYNEVMNKPEKKSEVVDTQSYNPEVIKIRRYDQLNGKNIRLRNQRVQIPDHKEKLHSEKVIRRHKFVLPRIEKKLYIMLMQYREEQKGEDFLWKDKPVIEELGNIQVTQDEINQNRIRFNRIKKKVESNNNTEMDTETVKSPSKHRRSMFVSYDKMEPKKAAEESKNKKSPRKSALPKKLKRIIAED